MRFAVGLAAAVSVAAAVSPSARCSQALCDAEALAPFFEALSQARGPGAQTVHILDIGDSHSAGDSITGPWRVTLQARFGSGGRGVLPPGKPFDGFLPHGVHVDQTPGWTVESTFRADPVAPPAFGVSGFRLTSTQDAAQLLLTAEPQEAFRRLTVCAEIRPGAGAYRVTLGAVSSRVSLDGPGRRIDCESFTAVDPQTQAVLVTEGGPVTLTSWASFSDAGGVSVSNLGVVGAELKHFARTDDQAVAEELLAYHPALIVLEFGTNDGFVSHFSAAGFESRLRGQIARLKQLSGGAPILIIGAPDAETKRPDLRHNDDEGGPIPRETTVETEPAAPAPLVEPPAQGPGEATIEAQANLAEHAPASETRSAWFSPPALAQVREIQRRVAMETGVAFWDWGARMGGPGAADRWASAAPPLTRADHVHTTTAGGVQVAAMLQADLDQAYAAWSASRQGP